MKSMNDVKFCGIIEAVCPYEHDCSMCRLQTDYEVALEKSQKLMEEMERSRK